MLNKDKAVGFLTEYKALCEKYGIWLRCYEGPEREQLCYELRLIGPGEGFDIFSDGFGVEWQDEKNQWHNGIPK